MIYVNTSLANLVISLSCFKICDLSAFRSSIKIPFSFRTYRSLTTHSFHYSPLQNSRDMSIHLSESDAEILVSLSSDKSNVLDDKESTGSSSPKWVRELSRNFAKFKDPASKYMQMATTDGNSNVSCRTVVFRGFLQDILGPRRFEPQTLLKVITDLRSRKIGEISMNPQSEICWYFPKTREQLRIRGVCKIVTKDERDDQWCRARLVQWKQTTEQAKTTFFRPCPGVPLDSSNLNEDNLLEQNLEIPSDNFCLLVIQPYVVDHLLLRSNQRFIHTREMEKTCLNAFDTDASTEWRTQEVVV